MAGLKFRILKSFWLLLAFSLFIRQAYIFGLYTLSVLIHESAHYFVAKKCGYKCNCIAISAFGAVLYGEFDSVDNRDGVKIALAGPAANAVCALVFVALWWMFPALYVFSQPFVAANVSLCLINLLPAYPLDGGRILHLALSRFGERRARLICRAVTMLVAAGVLAYFVRSCFSRPAWTALVFSVLLAAGAFGGARYSRLTFSRGKSFSRGVEERRVVIDAARTVQDALRYLTEERYLVLVLYAEGEYLGELTEEEYLAALSAGKYAEPLSECLPKL